MRHDGPGRRLPHRARAAPDLVRRVAAGHRRFQAQQDAEALRRATKGLLASLNDLFLVEPRSLNLDDRPRPHRRNRQGRIVYELHGQCSVDGPIQVYLRTAAREQPVALLTLLDTVCHEWVHHYDFRAFGDSIHCQGFYERLKSVYRPVREVLR